MQGWLYDAAGFITVDDDTSYTRDAAGRNVEVSGSSHASYKFDGDGRMLKKVLNRAIPNSTLTTTVYYLNSSMLGGLTVAELSLSGQKTTRYLYAGNRKLAQEEIGAVTWSHREPVTGSRGNSTATGDYIPQAEFNADGMDVGFSEPVETGPELPEPLPEWGVVALGSNCSSANPTCKVCYLDGSEHDCNRINWQASDQCPNNDCGPRRVPDENGKPKLTPLTRNPHNGVLGYWPNGHEAPGFIHDPMGNPMRLSPEPSPSAAGGGTPIYGRSYTEAIYTGILWVDGNTMSLATLHLFYCRQVSPRRTLART